MHLVYPPPPPRNFAESLSSISLGTTVIWLCNLIFFGGGGGRGWVNKMHCGVYKNCEFATLETQRELGRVKFRKDVWDCY